MPPGATWRRATPSAKASISFRRCNSGSPILKVRLQTARVFLREAAWKLDCAAPDATKACAMAKLYVTDAAFEVANQCLQLHGGYGYLADYGIEKIVRDLRVHQILEGTNEIMRVIIAREVLAHDA